MQGTWVPAPLKPLYSSTMYIRRGPCCISRFTFTYATPLPALGLVHPYNDNNNTNSIHSAAKACIPGPKTLNHQIYWPPFWIFSTLDSDFLPQRARNSRPIKDTHPDSRLKLLVSAHPTAPQYNIEATLSFRCKQSRGSHAHNLFRGIAPHPSKAHGQSLRVAAAKVKLPPAQEG